MSRIVPATDLREGDVIFSFLGVREEYVDVSKVFIHSSDASAMTQADLQQYTRGKEKAWPALPVVGAEIEFRTNKVRSRMLLVREFPGRFYAAAGAAKASRVLCNVEVYDVEGDEVLKEAVKKNKGRKA